METVAYGGWERCARIVSGDVEAIVTLEVGPRVVRLGFIGDLNEFHENPKEMGKTSGDEYHSYGGHRLWIAPEDKVKTYQPENNPVEAIEEDGWYVFGIPNDSFGMEKELRIKPTGDGGFHLEHRITNNGTSPVHMAPWAITVMATGGVCLIPQEPYKPFPAILTPVRPVVLWSYADMTDPRFTWGKELIQLRQDANIGPTKIGTYISQGYAGYHSGDHLFIKKFSAFEGWPYPDFGCNFETFTRQDMLEIESLGPTRDLVPGETAIHFEAWGLFKGVGLPSTESELYKVLASHADQTTIPTGL
jgi:hypothetical protein